MFREISIEEMILVAGGGKNPTQPRQASSEPEDDEIVVTATRDIVVLATREQMISIGLAENGAQDLIDLFGVSEGDFNDVVDAIYDTDGSDGKFDGLDDGNPITVIVDGKGNWLVKNHSGPTDFTDVPPYDPPPADDTTFFEQPWT